MPGKYRLHYPIDNTDYPNSEYRKTLCNSGIALDENSKNGTFHTMRSSRFTRDIARVTCKRCLQKINNQRPRVMPVEVKLSELIALAED